MQKWAGEFVRRDSMRFEYVDTDGNETANDFKYLKFKRDSVFTARKSAGANSLDFAQEWLVGQGCHCIDRHQRLAKRNVHAESVDSLLNCLFDVTIFVGNKRRRTFLCIRCHGDRMML